MIHPGFPHLTAEAKRFIDERLERGEGMTRIRLMMLVRAHMHYAGSGEAENAEAIEYELEQLNYHELLDVLRNHNYGHAIDWIKERYALFANSCRAIKEEPMKEYIVLVFTKRMGACNMWPTQHVEAIRAFADTKEHAAEAAEQKLISENAGLDILCVEKTAVCEADQVPVVCWQKGAP